MRKIFTWEFQVRSYEAGRFGFVENATFINYLEELALRASADAGYGSEWFEKRGLLWVIRNWTVRLYEPVFYGDALEGRTWVSDFRRVQSNREYEIMRGETRILRARANWVFVEWKTLRPTRLLSEFFDAYQPSGEVQENLDTRLSNAISIAESPRFVIERKVHYYELDKVWHVNNANYVRWVEEACIQAMESAGWSQREHQWRILSHEIEYKHGAQAGDAIRITSWVAARTATQMEWRHEICHQASGDVIATDSMILDLAGGTIPMQFWGE